jgi:hypothetical protein
MTQRFNGIINVDTRDSVPDWAPYLQPVAPEGSPNVLYIVLDDVGFSAMEPWGGLTTMSTFRLHLGSTPQSSRAVAPRRQGERRQGRRITATRRTIQRSRCMNRPPPHVHGKEGSTVRVRQRASRKRLHKPEHSFV